MAKNNPSPVSGTRRGFLRPTTTPTPDELFDVWLSVLAGAELKVLLYIVRRTLGFKKDADSISLRQICEGITTRDGRILDQGTGLARKTAFQAVQSLEERGLITVDRQLAADGDNQINVYRLAFVEADGLPRYEQNTEKTSPGVGTKSTYGRYKKNPRVGTKDTPQQTVIQETVLQEQQQHASADKSEGFDVVVALTKRGISENVAKKLASEYSAELIADKLELLDFLQDSQSKLVKRNPAGYLRKAIEEDYQAPPNFKNKAQRDAELKAKEELELLMEQQEEKRTQEKEEARQHWREQLITEHQIGKDQLAFWQKVKEQVRENQSIQGLKYWLDESLLLAQQNGKVVVAFRYAYPSSKLAESIVEEVESAISAELQRPVQVHFEVIAGAE